MRRSTSSLAPGAGKLAALLLSSLMISPSHAIQFESVAAPPLNLNNLGRVAIAGDFDGVSLYQYKGQGEAIANTNGSTGILARFPNGAFTTLKESDATIQTMCPFVVKNGDLTGVVFGGNFTSVGGQESHGVALMKPDSGEIVPLAGLSGSVSAVYCDKDSSTVYVGGQFSGGNSTNAIAWTTNWNNMPFAGFNGPVYSIQKASNGNIIFAGQFDGIGNSSALPDDLDQQVIPLGSANLIEALTASGRPGLQDPKSVICKEGSQDGPGNTFLYADHSPGSWRAKYDFGFQPSKLRLYNTQFEGRGIKTFKVTAFPINGIMNFSYVGPDGNKAYCDSRCPMPEKNITEQDFTFVNGVGMNEFRIDIDEWWGPGAGFTGIEMFSNEVASYAVNRFNQPTCDGVSTAAGATTTGPWNESPSASTTSNYLTAVLTGGQIDPNAASVVFKPNIKQSGNYSVLIYTPGCDQDGTCGNRGRVAVTGVMSAPGSQNSVSPVNTILYQTNNFDKYDSIYSGYIDVSSGFQPTVTLTPDGGQNGPITIVAQRVRFELLSNGTSGGLNGIFEFNPNQAISELDFSKSEIDQSGKALNGRAIIRTLVTDGDTLYAAGNFSSKDFTNIYSLNGGGPKSLPGGGLNQEVMAMHMDKGSLYVGGSFTNTRNKDAEGLNGVCVYTTQDQKWKALGNGVSGTVSSVIPLAMNISGGNSETVYAMSGSFDKINAFDKYKDIPADGLAIWVPSQNNWLSNISPGSTALYGKLTAQTQVPGFDDIYAGSVSSQTLGSSGSASLINKDHLTLQSWTFKVQPKENNSSSSNSSLTRRAVIESDQQINGVATGLVAAEGALNITIMGGHFTAISTEGKNISNLLFVKYVKGTNGEADHEQVYGLDNELSKNSTILSLTRQAETLFAGGSLTGKLGNTQVGGLIRYDLTNSKLADAQPPALTGDKKSEVKSLALQPKSNNLWVGGNFEAAGSLNCPSLCVFDTDRLQWNAPDPGFSGNLTSLIWTSDTTLVLSGDMTVGGNKTYMATYDSKSKKFQEFPGAKDLPGPVASTTPANIDGTQFWASGKNSDGSTWLQRYNGVKWLPAPQLGDGTNIQSLQVFMLTTDHEDSPLIDRNQALLIMGNVNVPNFGNCSGVLFDGKNYNPFILSTDGNKPGLLTTTFVEKPYNFFKNDLGHLAKGFVVLIALAISLALIFLIVLAGMLVERIRRKREGYMLAPTNMNEKGNENMSRIPPEQLFGSVNQGTTSRRL